MRGSCLAAASGKRAEGFTADGDEPRRRRGDLVADAPPAVGRDAPVSAAEPRMIRANFRCSGVDMPTSAGIQEGDSRRTQSLGGPMGVAGIDRRQFLVAAAGGSLGLGVLS